jgi:hypothetical protein
MRVFNRPFLFSSIYNLSFAFSLYNKVTITKANVRVSIFIQVDLKSAKISLEKYQLLFKLNSNLSNELIIHIYYITILLLTLILEDS